MRRAAYAPQKINGGTDHPLPVIVSVHGGGWVFGSKEGYQFYCMSLAQLGFTIVNFSYRLAPEFPFPANIEDINSVMSWVMISTATCACRRPKKSIKKNVNFSGNIWFINILFKLLLQKCQNKNTLLKILRLHSHILYTGFIEKEELP